MARKQQRELEEQAMVAQWFNYSYPKHKLIISASGGSRHPLEAANLKRSGLVRGIPDILVPRPTVTAAGLWIEFKPTTLPGIPKARVRPEQKEMIEYLNAQGYIALVCWGFDETTETIRNYMLLE